MPRNSNAGCPPSGSGPVAPHGVLALVLLALLPAQPAGAGPDRLGRTETPETRLGQRLAGPPPAPPGDAAWWREAKRIIEASDAAADARADAAAGHAGFMAHANDAIAERPVAPGVFCRDRSEPARRAVLVFHYAAPPAELGRALLAFNRYARAYNGHLLGGGALGETSCAPSGQ